MIYGSSPCGYLEYMEYERRVSYRLRSCRSYDSARVAIEDARSERDCNEYYRCSCRYGRNLLYNRILSAVVLSNIPAQMCLMDELADAHKGIDVKLYVQMGWVHEARDAWREFIHKYSNMIYMLEEDNVRRFSGWLKDNKGCIEIFKEMDSKYGYEIGRIHIDQFDLLRLVLMYGCGKIFDFIDGKIGLKKLLKSMSEYDRITVCVASMMGGNMNIVEKLDGYGYDYMDDRVFNVCSAGCVGDAVEWWLKKKNGWMYDSMGEKDPMRNKSMVTYKQMCVLLMCCNYDMCVSCDSRYVDKYTVYDCDMRVYEKREELSDDDVFSANLLPSYTAAHTIKNAMKYECDAYRACSRMLCNMDDDDSSRDMEEMLCFDVDDCRDLYEDYVDSINENTSESGDDGNDDDGDDGCDEEENEEEEDDASEDGDGSSDDACEDGSGCEEEDECNGSECSSGDCDERNGSEECSSGDASEDGCDECDGCDDGEECCDDEDGSSGCEECCDDERNESDE